MASRYERLQYAESMVEKLQAAMLKQAGVKSVDVDGTTVNYDPATTLNMLRYWEKVVARLDGSRPRIASIDLDQGT